MIIKELELLHFGKFHDKKIVLNDQVNLIYGLNESGKTTLWHFIVGMFFGFFKPYIKTRRYLEVHGKYQPWGSSQYCGSMTIYDEGLKRTLRIYRNFRQGEEAVTVHDLDTGEDITGLYEMHPVFRLPDIAKMHLKLSYFGYTNMGAISQLGHATDDNLLIELKQAVVNALSSKTLNVSMHKLQQKLDNEIGRIGSKNKKTSVYAKSIEKLESLQIERQHVLNNEQKLFEDIQYQKTLEHDLATVQEQLYYVQVYEQYIQKKQLSERLDHIKTLNQEQYNIQEKITTIKRNTPYSLEEIYDAKEKYAEKFRLESTLSTLEQKYQEDHKIQDDLLDQIKSCEEQEKTFKLQPQQWKNYGFWGLLFFMGLIGIFSLVQHLWGLAVLMGVAMGVQSILGVFRQRHIAKQRADKAMLAQQKQQYYEQLEKVKEQGDTIQGSIRQVHQQLVKINEELMPIMNLLAMQNIHDFEERIAEYQKIKGYELERIRLEEQEKNLLGANDYASLEKQVQAYDFAKNERIMQKWNQEQLNAWKDSKEMLLDKQQQIRYEQIKISTQLQESRKAYKTLTSIDEEIEETQKRKQGYEHELKVYKIIDTTLEKITKELKYEFAPSMNQTLSHLLTKITSGKYTEVKITSDMEIMFKDPISKRMQGVSTLSRGTMDLFYIAFRYAIAKWSQHDQQIPFVLDEVFAYFDDARLNDAMDALTEFNAQVILFTCQEREKILAENKSMHIIHL